MVQKSTVISPIMRKLSAYIASAPGRQLPAVVAERAKHHLLVPVLGIRRTESLIDAIWNIERIEDLRDLRPLLRPSKAATS